MIEAAADFGAGVMERVVADLAVSAESLRAALRRAVVAGAVDLAFAGAALPNRGVELLLDAVVDYLPSPADRPDLGDAGGPVRALVFGRVHEPADAVAVRLYAGGLAAGVELDCSGGVRRRGAEDPDTVERAIVANADQLAIVSALANPEPRPRLIDRCLVAAFDADKDGQLSRGELVVNSPEKEALVKGKTLTENEAPTAAAIDNYVAR